MGRCSLECLQQLSRFKTERYTLTQVERHTALRVEGSSDGRRCLECHRPLLLWRHRSPGHTVHGGGVSRIRFGTLWNESLTTRSNWSSRLPNSGNHPVAPSRHRRGTQLLGDAFHEESKNTLRRIFLTPFSLLHAPRLARSTPGNFNYVFHGEQRATERIQPPASISRRNHSHTRVTTEPRRIHSVEVVQPKGADV